MQRSRILAPFTAARAAMIFSTLLLASVLVAAASAQDRPTLERLREELCLKAERDGDSYRPRVCDPRCDCMAGFLGGDPPTRCEEVQPGDFEVDKEFPSTALCTGTPALPLVRLCIWPVACVTDGDCPAGYICGNPDGSTGDLCHVPLEAPQCNIVTAICCVNGSDCPPVPPSIVTMELLGVVPVTSTATVECAAQGDPGSQKFINSVDANECLEQVEAASSLDCGFRCGNGLVDSSHGETCDDGNQTPGDGCDASCQIEGGS